MGRMRTYKRRGVLHPSAIRIELTFDGEVKAYGCIKELLDEHTELNRYAVNKLMSGIYMRKYKKYTIRKI